MRIGTLLIIFMIFLTQAWGQTTCSPLIGYCSYYKCISQNYSCEKEDYFQSFGEKYCRYFESVESRFTAYGQRFLRNVAVCLQTKIDTHQNGLTCENAKPRAADHHIECYVNSGFCRLNFFDQYRIFRAIIKPVLVDQTFQIVAQKITSRCRGF